MSTSFPRIDFGDSEWLEEAGQQVRKRIITALRAFPEWVNLETIASELNNEFASEEISNLLASMLRDGEIGCKAELDTEVFGKYCPCEVCVYGLPEGANRERTA